MSVEDARQQYLWWAQRVHAYPAQHPRPAPSCARCQWASLQADAASLAYDLAVAEAHPAEPPLSLVAY